MGKILLAIVSFFVVGQTAAAAHQAEQGCRGDQPSGPCAEERRLRLLETYGVRSIEEHRAAGDQVRRVFYAGRSGYDLLLIAFVRPRGGDPIVSVHFPRRRGGGRVEPPLQAALPWTAWQDVLFHSAYFDRELAPLPPRTGSRSICMDGGTYLVEATDPARSREEPATLRRAFEHTCEFGLAQHYATDIERAALPLFPYCARLDPRQYPSPLLQLEACRSLRGDRMAAAEVLNAAEAFRAISGRWDAARLARVLSERSRIDWNGERNEAGGAAAFWAAHATPGIGVANISYEAIEGESADRVRLTGTLSRYVQTRRGGGSAIETARVEQLWVRDLGSFRVESATVGPWEPYPPRPAASGAPNRN